MGGSNGPGGRIRFKNSQDIYDLLRANATKTPGTELVEYGYPAKPEEELWMYRGFVTKHAVTELGLLNSSISHAMSLLNAMNAVTPLVKGGPGRPSIYLIHYKPTVEQFEEFTGRSIRLERKISPSRYDALINDIVTLRERLTNLEHRIEALEGKPDDSNDIRGSQALPEV